MVRAAWGGARDADAIVHLIDVEAQAHMADGNGRGSDRLAVQDAETIAKGLAASSSRAFLALNKIDLVKKERLLGLTQALFDPAIYSEVFMISASGGAGVARLKQTLAAAMPEGPWFYPADQSADIPARLLAAEITREKVYLRVHEELPYAAAVETTAFEERADGSARIEQTIYVERDGQRAIVLGKGGSTLKWIGQAAREELCGLLDRPVHLFLHVKVKPGWAEDRAHYGDVGLDFDV
jgi:GTP-binding protein Era